MVSLMETEQRLYSKLFDDLGETIIEGLLDENINEILVNPDGSLWVDHAKEGLKMIGLVPFRKTRSIIQMAAGISDCIVNSDNPLLEAKLPTFKAMNGERFTAQIPPIVPNPCFTIRKFCKVLSMDEYLSSGRMTSLQAQVLKALILERKNILICGGTGSGKTTFTNMLISEAIALAPNERFLILEDSREIKYYAPSQVPMLTRKKGNKQDNLRELVQTALRNRPDRILVGEVRGSEALEMLKAWNTGCSGGICTLHANGAREAVQRLCDLSLEAGLIHPPINLIQQTIGAIIFIKRCGPQNGFLDEILTIRDVQDEKFIFEKLA